MTASYRDDGHLLARTDPTGGTRTYDRDARGRVTRLTDELGRVTTISLDASGLPVQVVDPGGSVHLFERDARGNVLLYTDPAGAVRSYRYDERGLCTQIVDATAGRTGLAYDAQGNLTEVTGPNGAVWRYTYDALGRRLSETDPLGGVTRYAWSARGDLVAVHDAAGGVTRYAYDGEGHLVQVVDPRGGVTAMVWGGYHKLCIRRDANGHEVRLGYNLEGELIVVRNERGEEHRLTYDPSGKLIEELTFDGRRLGYRHDRAGRVIRIQNGEGAKTSLTYDLAGQLVQRELPDGSIETFAYDPLGSVVHAAWPGGEVRFERDALGRIVREAQVVGGEEHHIEIAHDPVGERVGRRTSLGHTEAIERGALGARRRTVLDGEHVVEHESDVLGREHARALPGGGRIESAFDVMGRLERRRVLGPAATRAVGPGEPMWVGPRADGVTVETAYRYDPAGELIDVWDRQWGQTAYRYDPIGQLLARVPEKARGEVFRYDPAGNLHEGGPEAAPREYGRGNRLLRKGNAEYLWDRDGRLSEKVVQEASGKKEVWRYRWDAAGMLRSVEKPDGEVVAFAYDPFGRRVEKRVSTAGGYGQRPVVRSATRFVWDGDVLVHEITRRAEAAGDPVVEVKTYCFEDDGFAPVAHRDGGGWFHYVNDPIGTPERLVGADGKVACELRREAWGRTVASRQGGTRTQLRFQGQYEDEETGLCYNRFRYYDPEAARFVSADPIGLQGGIHLYRAVMNPIAWADPLGLTQRWIRSLGRESAAGQLPRFSGRSVDYVRRSCQEAGFRVDPEKQNASEEHWVHPDGSQVRINVGHKPDRGEGKGGFLGDTEKHVHKEIIHSGMPKPTTLDDHGFTNDDPNRTHIILRQGANKRSL